MKTMLVMLCAGATLVGCGAVPPRVQYQQYELSDGTQAFGFPFRQRRSLLLLKQEGGSFKIESAPSESDADGKFTATYMLSGVDDLRSTTQVKMTYLDNTKLPDKIDITTKDNVADTITKVGDVIAAAIPLVAGAVAAPAVAAAPTFKQTVIDPANAPPDKWVTDAVNPEYCIKVSDLNTEQSVALSEYVKTRVGKKVADFPVPSCSSAVIEVAPCSDAAKAVRLQPVFASATQVTPMPLPSSGSLRMNSACGATVTEADKQDRTDLLTYLQTVMTKAKEIQAASKKK